MSGSQRLALPAGRPGRPTRRSPAPTARRSPWASAPRACFDAATADPSWPRLVADVELVENLPPEKLVHLRVDAEPVVTDATVEIAKDIDAAAAEDLRVDRQGHRRSTRA